MTDVLTELQAATKSDLDKCIKLLDDFKQLRDTVKAVQDISDKSKLELSFIAARKCEDKIQQSDTFLEKRSLKVKVSITFHPNSDILQYLLKLSELGRIEHSSQILKVQDDSNEVLTVQGKSVQNVRISSDSDSCII
ncbi:hypothetical protein DPMN_076619 [Dreissena polymorpha]|uniref:Uncharacterized protein n=1 Tax=Dreissena polymorpha TaxID=45954 RepID=A0A9D4BMJ8_DREPO|nr:hypothetical protein DPMN_076619 [Dreissena polymorpha]